MKRTMVISIVVGLVSCNSGTNNSRSTDSISSVPGTFPVDTNISGMDTDNHQINSPSEIALDSPGPTITPKDTNYRQKK